ncbi:MAG: molybdopterin-guanine dinucleotide biosynthesis protein B [Gemmatimonadales bacterium]|nr:MAG: molybdopterin-guanine dinucleotide biosynthesis protein B [Gemmatimonadales bacterium]
MRRVSAGPEALQGATLGVVLAGGESRRFGGMKALASFQGEPMARRALRLLEGVFPEVVLVTGHPAVMALAPGATLPDRIPGLGPLGGLHAALHEARSRGLTGVLLLACDMPAVPPSLVTRILVEAEASGARAVVPGIPGDLRGSSHPLLREPLCAWYSVTCLPEVEARVGPELGPELGPGVDRSLMGLLDAVEARILPLAPPGEAPWRLGSANTREELGEMERRVAEDEVTVPVLCVVGFKDSGKTGVAVGLVRELRQRGLRVGAVKHGHGFRLDTPGTDSWRLRQEGGADPVLLTGPEGYALMGGWDEAEELPLAALLKRHFAGVDLVVVEGFKGSGFPRVEVFRPSAHPEPFHQSVGTDPGHLLTMVTDDLRSEFHAPVVGLDDPRRSALLADRVMEALQLQVPGAPSPEPSPSPEP